ncbi:MAG TPA: hypothetical protein VK253_00825, partial [Candidatus Binatia bacterium]|nr:hypothetical protein [Candidatus Binatia bacterium]
MKTNTSITRLLRTGADSRTFGMANLKKFLSENYPLLSILLGFMLVAISVGPYYNGDTAWEFDAVSGVTKYGL